MSTLKDDGISKSLGKQGASTTWLRGKKYNMVDYV